MARVWTANSWLLANGHVCEQQIPGLWPMARVWTADYWPLANGHVCGQQIPVWHVYKQLSPGSHHIPGNSLTETW